MSDHDEVAVRGIRARGFHGVLAEERRAAEIALRAEEAERIEAGNDDLPLGARRAIDLAQKLVRVLAECL